MIRCSGCGKKIPELGKVCPYCHRDKSADVAAQGAGVIAMMIGGAIGYAIGGFGGMLIGGFALGIIAAIITQKPPEVRIAKDRLPASPNASSSTHTAAEPMTRLARLEALRASGVITEAEYVEQRAAIIKSL